MSTLLTFHNDPKIKENYLKRIHQHRLADEIIQGETGHAGRGCAVWCTLDDYSHFAYETELGIPQILAKLEDRIFEGLSVEKSKDFPLSFLSAIPIGVDLCNVYKHFFIWLLTDENDGVIKFARKGSERKAIRDVSDLLKKSLLYDVTSDEFTVVRKAAAAAAYAAYAAYADAGYAAAADAGADAYAAYAGADAYAAYAAAYAAADAGAAAYAAAAAAAAGGGGVGADAAAGYAAAFAADAYTVGAAAAAAARQSIYIKMSEKLIELLKATELVEN